MKICFRPQHIRAVSALPLALTLFTAATAFTQAKPSLPKADSAIPVSPAKVVEARVWLQFHDQKGFDDAVAKLYQPNSPTYRHWLKPSDLARYTPTAADVDTVTKELTSQGLTVTSVGRHNMYLKVKGTVGNMQTAFHTEIKTLSIKGEAMQATTTKPKVGGAAGSLVAAVSGLTDIRMHPNSVRPINPDTGKPLPAIPVASPNGIYYSSTCFRGAKAETFETAGAQLPIAQYNGNRYGANVTNSTIGSLPPCGYDAFNFTSAYNLTSAYAKGLDGTGQTIVIVDAYGSPTILDDANTFNSLNSLPAFTSSNFQVIYPLGPPQHTDPDWAGETSLDVEWAHAVAPGANIVLIVAPSNATSDLATSVFYAITNGLGSVISNSYSGFEALDIYYDDPSALIFNSVSELGAALGVSVNFSTGDYGDVEAAIGVKTVSDTGDSPYATAVGGTSLAINSNNKTKYQTGWGNNITRIVAGDGTIANPPLNEGFVYGAGGGESEIFAKPSWQSGLPGVGRQQPDVSLDADPYTGVEIILTTDGAQSIEVIGGQASRARLFPASGQLPTSGPARFTGRAICWVRPRPS